MPIVAANGKVLLMHMSFGRSIRRAAAIGCTTVLVLWGCAGLQPAAAASGPFVNFRGHWSGTGTIRVVGKNIERLRCDAKYQLLDSSGHQADVELSCKSDTYEFDLTSRIQADAGNHITGQWTEQTRGIGGSLLGVARGDHIQLHAESSGFTAILDMTTHRSEQSVKIDSHGGDQRAQASIRLHRR